MIFHLKRRILSTSSVKYYLLFVSICASSLVICTFLKVPMYLEENYNECFYSRLEGPLDQFDPLLIQTIKNNYLTPPSNLPYNLRLFQSDHDSKMYNNYRLIVISWLFINKALEELFQDKMNGFYIEAGALDGEQISNTLDLEVKKNWTGLLVEPDLELFTMMKAKNRKASLCHCCLATKTYAYEGMLSKVQYVKKKDFIGSNINFKGYNAMKESRTIVQRENKGYITYENVQCFPIASILKALDVTRIDLFSLDIEDLEMEVLLTFPWGSVYVEVWLVEHRNPKTHLDIGDEDDQQFIEFFYKNNYVLFKKSTHSPRDYIFVHSNSTLATKFNLI